MDLRVDPDADLAPLIRHLERDGLMGYPTETVYGLGGLCTPGAIARIRSAKGRPADKPLIALLPNAESAEGLRWTEDARELATIFWPGALTLILNDPTGRCPPGVRSGQGGVAVRVSPHPLVQALLGVLGSPLVSTSANVSGGTPALGAARAFELARELGAGESMWVLDGGFLEASDHSTIVDCTGSVPSVIRSGTIPLNRMRCVLPELDEKH